MNEWFVRGDDNGVAPVTIRDLQVPAVELSEERDVVRDSKAFHQTRRWIGGFVPRIVEEGSHQPAHAIGLARLEVDTVADWMEKHPQGQFLRVFRMD